LSEPSVSFLHYMHQNPVSSIGKLFKKMCSKALFKKSIPFDMKLSNYHIHVVQSKWNEESKVILEIFHHTTQSVEFKVTNTEYLRYGSFMIVNGKKEGKLSKKSVKLSVVSYLSSIVPIETYITLRFYSKKLNKEEFIHIPVKIECSEELKKEYYKNPILRYLNLQEIESDNKGDDYYKLGDLPLICTQSEIKGIQKISVHSLTPLIGYQKGKIFYARNGAIDPSNFNQNDQTRILYNTTLSLKCLYDFRNKIHPLCIKIRSVNGVLDLPIFNFEIINGDPYNSVMLELTERCFKKKSKLPSRIAALVDLIRETTYYRYYPIFSALSSLNDLLYSLSCLSLDIEKENIELVEKYS